MVDRLFWRDNPELECVLRSHMEEYYGMRYMQLFGSGGGEGLLSKLVRRASGKCLVVFALPFLLILAVETIPS